MVAAARILTLVEPVLAGLGLEVADCEVKPGLVRITVERSDGAPGPDLALIADATRLVSKELDVADPFQGRYTLELSSPGLERPLRTPAHFRRALGRTVSIRTRPGTEGERRAQGVLAAADDTGVTVAVAAPGADGDIELHFAYDDIERARTVFEWGPGPKPGKGPSSRKPAAKAPTKEAAS